VQPENLRGGGLLTPKVRLKLSKTMVSGQNKALKRGQNRKTSPALSHFANF
jgi:hypothetical protein